jgi:hypothetical protein
MPGNRTDGEPSLAERLRTSDHQSPIKTTLRTDARVIARVTDGIYRQPGSALRELISNAYDADATRVTIRTDRPRFQRMVIEDNGSGMTPETLEHLMHHIGGSAKRTSIGRDLGITSYSDLNLSPSGRPLIGKIGIGLFSVAQLTQGFQIITKVAGDDRQTIATVVLRQYSEQVLEHPDAEYDAGKVLVWMEPSADIESHGTTIVLDAIRPQTRETLRSADLWEAVYGASSADTTDEPSTKISPPRYHIGSVQPSDEDLLRSGAGYPHLPWASNDRPLVAFRKLVDSVWNAIYDGVPNPRLEQFFDYYLQMVWELSLWCPLPYVDVHPFDLTGDDDVGTYGISANLQVREIDLAPGQSLRLAAGLGSMVSSPVDFAVIMDDLELRRPLRLRGLPVTSSAVKDPIIFAAQENFAFDGIDYEISGGPLSFEAYFLWAPKIVPTDHQGVLVRVHDATGTAFDPTFLHFPVAEQRRLTQITCEIYITAGFDGAINIDRESFNFSHPHVVTLTKWLHLALRRVIATQKRIASAALQNRRAQGAQKTEGDAERIVDEAWNSRKGDDGTQPPEVVFADGSPSGKTSSNDAYVLPRSKIVGDMTGPNIRARRDRVESRLAKITQLLAAYGLFDRLPPEEQADLLAAIRQVLQTYDA